MLKREKSTPIFRAIAKNGVLVVYFKTPYFFSFLCVLFFSIRPNDGGGAVGGIVPVVAVVRRAVCVQRRFRFAVIVPRGIMSQIAIGRANRNTRPFARRAFIIHAQYALSTTATIERIVTDWSYSVWYSNRFQRWTITECIIVYWSNTITNSYRF